MNPFLLSGASAIQIQPVANAQENSDPVLVRGLFTTDLVDREAQFVDPLQFKLNVFKNTPVLLRNHKKIIDDNGNEVSAGKIKTTIPVKILQENPDNPSEWILKSLISDDIVANWPKHKSPNLVIGDRAVYVIAEVTNDLAKKEVLNGDLGAFSWAGLSRPISRKNGLVELTGVDLLEISLVDIPCNPDATFILTDENDPALNLEINLDECDVYQIKVDKSTHSLEDIKKYTKSLDTNTKNISENESHYFVQVGQPGLVDVSNSFEISKGNWTFIAAPKKNKSMKRIPRIGKLNSNVIPENNMSEDKNTGSDQNQDKVESEKFYMMDEVAFMKLVPNAVVSLQKSMDLAGMPVDLHFVELPAPTAVVEGDESQTPSENKEDETVSEGGKPDETGDENTVDGSEKPENPVAQLSETDLKIQALTDAVQNLVQNMAKEKEEKEQLELQAKSVDEIKQEAVKTIESKMKDLEEGRLYLENQRKDLNAKLARINAFEGAAPGTNQQQEPVQSSKSFDKSDEIDSKAYFANVIMKGVN